MERSQSDKVTTLKTVNTQPDPDVVLYLEDALKLAKTGQLREVAIFGSLVGGTFYEAFSIEDQFALVGHLERLKFRILSTPDTCGCPPEAPDGA